MFTDKNQILIFFSKKTNLFFIAALIIRTGYVFFYPPYGTDHVMIHTAVYNLLQGHGLSFPIADLNDLSAIHYQPMNEWPPLIGYIIYFAKVIFTDTRVTDIILMGTGIVLLLIVFKKIMKRIELPAALQTIAWLIIAINPEPFRMAGLTDIFGCLFMFCSILFVFKVINKQETNSTQIFFASIFFFLPAAFRYQYYPLIFICPLVIIIAGKVLKKRELYTKGFASFLIVGLLLTAQILFLYLQTGAGARIADDKTGFYFENLIHIYPFLVKGILNTSYFENTLVQFSNTGFIAMNLLFFFISIPILFFMARKIVAELKVTNATKEVVSKTLLLNKGIVFFISLSVILLLAGLSLLYSPQVNLYGSFTYVQEGRYFLVPSLLLLLLLLSAFEKQIAYSYTYKVVLGLILIINLSFFTKQLYNIVSGKQKIQGTSWTEERKAVLNEIVNQKQKINLPVVVAGYSYFKYQPIAKDYSIVHKLKQIESDEIKTTKPIQLLIITQPTPDFEEETFVKKKKATLIFVGKKCRMYQVVLGNR